jgi:hypothetical protein
MKGNRVALVVAVAAVLLLGGWWLARRGNGAESVDLLQTLDTARKEPAGAAIEAAGATINGETLQAISATPPTRITWKVTIPDNAWLRVSMGTKEESWTQEGNGAYFLVGVSDGQRFDELFTEHVNPFVNPGDRKWIPVWVDISAYSGEEVELIFNTRNGPPEPAGAADDTRNDTALWGAPAIVVR